MNLHAQPTAWTLEDHPGQGICGSSLSLGDLPQPYSICVPQQRTLLSVTCCQLAPGGGAFSHTWDEGPGVMAGDGAGNPDLGTKVVSTSLGTQLD